MEKLQPDQAKHLLLFNLNFGTEEFFFLPGVAAHFGFGFVIDILLCRFSGDDTEMKGNNPLKGIS